MSGSRPTTIPSVTPVRRRSVAVAAVSVAVLAAVAMLSGCGRHLIYEDGSSFNLAITEIQIVGGSGDVVVAPGDKSRTEIQRTFTYRGTRPSEDTFRIEGTVLHISTDCQQFNCDISYAIKAPDGVRVSGSNESGDIRVAGVSTVDLQVESGDIRVRGATGNVNVRAESGDISLIDVAGTTTARTSSGNIETFGSKAPTLTVEAGSGDLRLELATPSSVSAQTDSGDIRVAAPTGDYKVDTDTSSGNVQVRIPTSPSGTHALRLTTGSGDIAVNPR